MSSARSLSSQITAATVLDADGAVLATSANDPAASARLSAATQELLTAAGALGADAREVTRVEVELRGGCDLHRERRRAHRRRDDRAEPDVGARRATSVPAFKRSRRRLRRSAGRGRRPSRRRRSRSEEAHPARDSRGARGVGPGASFFGSSGRSSAQVSRTQTAPPSSSSPGRRASSASRRSPAPRFGRDGRRARRAARRPGAARGGLRPPVRTTIVVVPRQVPLRDRARDPAALGNALAEEVKRASPMRCGSPAGARGGRVGSFGSDGVRPAVHHRPR